MQLQLVVVVVVVAVVVSGGVLRFQRSSVVVLAG
jgi:hypothetical protein